MGDHDQHFHGHLADFDSEILIVGQMKPDRSKSIYMAFYLIRQWVNLTYMGVSKSILHSDLS